MNPYQTAQNRINQLVGVKPTKTKNTFKNKTDMNKSQETLEAMYLDYVNNFLTVGAFADYYDISEELATAIINEFSTSIN